jgi:hypothetical protein
MTPLLLLNQYYTWIGSLFFLKHPEFPVAPRMQKSVGVWGNSVCLTAAPLPVMRGRFFLLIDLPNLPGTSHSRIQKLGIERRTVYVLLTKPMRTMRGRAPACSFLVTLAK